MDHRFGFLLVFIGGGLGSVLRHAVNKAAASLFGLNFPYGTLFVNVAGSLAMGLVAGWFAFRAVAGQATRLFLTTGVLGGFTTFSAFSMDAALLWERRQTSIASVYVLGSVITAIASLFGGLWITRTLLMK
jgi:CrcB protein